MSPEVGAISFMIIRPVVVLPHPDSPTSPVPPARMSKLMPSTARTAAGGPLAQSPRRTGKCFTRARTSSSTGVDTGSGVTILLLREEAADGAPGAGLDQGHLRRLALRAGLVAARGERAAGGQV